MISGKNKVKLRVRSHINRRHERCVCVFKSKKHLYVQLIEKAIGGCKVLLSMSTNSNQFKKEYNEVYNFSNKKFAAVLSKLVAQELIKRNYTSVVFNRSGYRYHGVVKLMCDTMRDEGLKI